MKVRLCVLGEVKVDDHIDSLNVNASGEQVWWREGGWGTRGSHDVIKKKLVNPFKCHR